MLILTTAVAVALIGSFASSFTIVFFGSLVLPKYFPNPMAAKFDFGKSGWLNLSKISAAAWVAVFLSALIFFGFSKGSIKDVLYYASIVATVGLIGFLNFMYFIFLLEKPTI
jgi:hypothetical protein